MTVLDVAIAVLLTWVVLLGLWDAWKILIRTFRKD